jgi:uncharacterized protein Yka (UPF0111/DUF47 family)
VDNAERAADRVTHDVNRMMHKTFITPIDRDQIHADQHHGRRGRPDPGLRRDHGAVRRAPHDGGDHPPDRPEREVLRACARCGALLPKIADPATAEAALKTCEEIDRLESDADRVMRRP